MAHEGIDVGFGDPQDCSLFATHRDPTIEPGMGSVEIVLKLFGVYHGTALEAFGRFQRSIGGNFRLFVFQTYRQTRKPLEMC